MPEYFNILAQQIVVIASLLCGFSVAAVANFVTSEIDTPISKIMMNSAIVAACAFLVSVFAMTKIIMVTTSGAPDIVAGGDHTATRLIGLLSLIIGTFAIMLLIALSGWSKSKKSGVFTTIVAVITTLLLMSFMIEVG